MLKNCEFKIKVYFYQCGEFWNFIGDIWKKSLATLELHLSAVFVWSGSTKFSFSTETAVVK